MTITNESIFQADYEVVRVWRGFDGANDEGNHPTKKVIVPEQFKDDVDALCEYSGLTELSPGTRIKLSLQEALGILPRERRRIDSYKSLVRFLQDEMGVTLNIHSQKTKKYEE